MHIRIDDVFPFVAWIRGYRRQFLKPDLVAGLTVAVVAVPQSMAYALIAGLPVQFGLYASIVPTIIACLWGSSAHLITGPTTAVSLVLFSVLGGLASPSSDGYLELVMVLALLVGVIQLVMGFARLGALLNFVSHSVLIGFTTGAAALIAFKQLPGFLGLDLSPTAVFHQYLVGTLARLHQIAPVTMLLGMLTIGVVVGVRRYRPTWPGPLLAMVLAGSLVALFNLDQKGVAVVGAIPQHLPPVRWPSLEALGHVGQLAPGALAIAILGLVEAVSIAKAIAEQTHQRIDINREFIGQGLGNIGAALFSGYAGSGSFTRSAVNFNAGAKTPVSGIVSALGVAATIVLAAPLAAQLPIATLAGVLIVVAFDMIRPRDIVRTIRTTRSDAAVLVITFLATVFLSIEFAIYVGVLLSIGLHLAATAHPHIHSVLPDQETGKMVGSAHGETCCQMDIVNIEGSVFFGSAAFVLDDLQRRLRSHPAIANLLIRMHKVNTLDASGIHTLEMVLAELGQRGGGLYFSGFNHRVFEVLKDSGLLREVGASHLRISSGAAIRQAMREAFDPEVCARCPVAVFKECPELKKGNWEIFGAGVQPRGSDSAQSGMPERTGGAVPTRGKGGQ
ncbi:MAG: SulP family inorganic anion transporter [Desulfatitalea sp.]|nr:SulP family inorganic anion transporter [Desulfatitalea sp.]